MTFAIAAAGTGGHVYPGLAVGEALVSLGVAPADVLYIGGSRLEATVYPRAGFPFLGVELRGLKRRLAWSNLGIPRVVVRAVTTIRAELEVRGTKALLGLGGYVTVPAGLAAGRSGARLAVAEQNAHAGLANRLMSRRAVRVFGSFPETKGLPDADWVGNPIRRALSDFDRERLVGPARRRWGLEADSPVVGVFGGSLGAGAINSAVEAMLGTGDVPFQVLHLAGHGFEAMEKAARASGGRWVVLDFCDDMESFYAACDLVIARAGGSVSELTATATPAVLVPGGFGSGGHQLANATVLERAGAAIVVSEGRLGQLRQIVGELAGDPARRRAMAEAASELARPDAATVIARSLMEMAS